MESPFIYKTTAHTLKGKGRLILIMTILSMAVMLLSIAITTSFIVGIPVFIISIYAVLYWFTGDAEYTLTNEGISRNVKPKLRYKYNKHEQNKFFRWDEIKSYKTGKDQFRTLQEFEFLEINLPDNETWEINNEKNKEGFKNFKEEFLKMIDKINSETDLQIINISKHNSSNKLKHIDRKKTFYESPWAKVFLWFMALLVVGIITFFIVYPKFLNWLRFFQLAFIILPAWVYIYYRLYGQKSK